MKTIIIYDSSHHMNTRKLAEALQGPGVAVVPITEAGALSLNDYDLIGLASGIEFSQLRPSIRNLVLNRLQPGMKVFFLYTAGRPSPRYVQPMEQAAKEKGVQVLGAFGCHGLDTWGPFALIGGMNRGHPDVRDIAAARTFFRQVTEKAGGRPSV